MNLPRSLTICAVVTCFFVCGFPTSAQTVVWHSGGEYHLTTTTVWRTGEIHAIGDGTTFIIDPGVTLTLEPGVIVKVGWNSVIRVNGALIGTGTSDNLIQILSLRDDSVGGDTNGDGNATVAGMSDWRYINVDGLRYKSLPIVALNYARIKHSKSGIYLASAGGFTLDNCDYIDNGGIIFIDAQSLNVSITHSNIYNPSFCDYASSTDSCHFISGIHSFSSQAFDLTNNFWGSADGPTFTTGTEPTQFKGVVLFGRSSLQFSPFATAPYEFGVEKQHPVIVIPGILGSWQDWQGVWQMDPILHSYDDLLDALRVAGYKDGESLFLFPYQWRQSNVITARELKVKIASAKAACVASETMDCSKVDLVAHSMGGLVARQYIESSDYADDVDQLIFIATPHKGSPKAYLMWEGGETESKPDDRPLNILLGLEAFNNGYSGTGAISKYIKGENIDSVKELLPVYHYLFDQSGNNSILRYYPDNYPNNSFLENLNSTVNMERLASIRMTNIVGDFGNSNTLNALYLVSSTKSGLWEDGMPLNYYSNPMQGLSYGPGDGTVPALSNSNFFGLDSIKINNQDHTHIVAYSQKEVIKELTGQEPQNEIHNIKIPNVLIIVMHSPADLMVTAPDGKKIGRDLNQSGQSVINEIPGAFYSGFGLSSTSEFVVISNPQDGQYKISAIGTDGGGQYSVTADYITETTSTESVYSGAILPDQQQALSFEFSSSSALSQEITANITIRSTISDVSLIYDKQLLISSTNKQIILTKYEALKTKVTISDGLLKLALSAKEAVINNTKLSSYVKSKMLALADGTIARISKERNILIVRGLNEITTYLVELKVKNMLLQLGYDILKADNDYLINNW